MTLYLSGDRAIRRCAEREKETERAGESKEEKERLEVQREEGVL